MGKAVTGDGGAVAILGEKRIYSISLAQIIVEKLVDNTADIFVYVSAVDEFLVVVGIVG